MALRQVRAVALNAITVTQKRLRQKVSDDSTACVSISAQFNKLRTAYFDSRYDIRGQAISWGIVTFALTAVILYCVGAYFREKRIALNPVGLLGNSDFMQSIKDSTWISVYMITVLLLIITIFILGLAGLLKENSLAALLGSVAGYVLNGKAATESSSTTPPKAPDVKV